MVAKNSVVVDVNDVFLNKKCNKNDEKDVLVTKYHVFAVKKDVVDVKKDVFPDISRFLPA